MPPISTSLSPLHHTTGRRARRSVVSVRRAFVGRLFPPGVWLLFVCALGVGAPGLLAQASDPSPVASPPPATFVHESWTVADGLPVNAITTLLQSQDGYLWIGTFDGLVRFDGVRFTVFNPGNSPGLPGSRIVDLQESGDGALWLRTEQKQLVRFRHGDFTHFDAERGLHDPVLTLFSDARGRLWVGTEAGVGVVEEERFVPVATEVLRGRVRVIHERPDGSLWIGADRSRIFRLENGAVTLVVPEGELPADDVLAIHEDGDGTLWISLWDSGLWKLRDKPESVLELLGLMRFQVSSRTGALWTLGPSEVFRVDQDGPRPVVPPSRPLYRPQRLVSDRDGWVLYSSGGELHREGQRIFTLPAADAERPGASEAITAILPDAEGSVWLGTFASGLHRLKPADFTVYSEPEGLSDRNVYSVYEDRNGTLWVGTLQGGTNRIANGEITAMPLEDGYPATAWSFLHDRVGRLWIGAGDGLILCPKPGDRCEPLELDDPPLSVRAIHQDPDGTLWFGAVSGLFRLADGDWNRWTAADGAPSATVRAFRRTRDGALWMGTDGGGLVRYRSGRFTRIGVDKGLPLNLIRSLHEDSDGWLWVGTEGGGLVRLDPNEWGEGARGRILVVGEVDGLFDKGIHQIVEDDLGRLWMSSNRGIFWVRRQELLDFVEGRVDRVNSIRYTERDGLRNREANGGSQPAGIRTEDGRIWFATQDGVAVVDPSRIPSTVLPPRVVIEQIRAGGRVLPAVPSQGLELGVDQRDLEIDFTALSLLSPDNIRFRYRLEGYDRDWVEAAGRRTAYYTQVPPGRYTFQVMASDHVGVWHEAGAALGLRLTPRSHETGAFRFLVLLTLALALLGAFGLRVRALRTRSRELEALVARRTAELENERDVTNRQAEALRELDRARSRFFANISHEFRTPLTLTIGPLEDLKGSLNGGAQGEPGRRLDMAIRNARRLLGLVDEILDVAKLEAGEIRLRARRQDLAAFAHGVASTFAAAAERKGIDFVVLAPDDPVWVWFDADSMEKVLGNLLSNAFKFTPAGGSIEVEVESRAGEASVRVRDTGPGIPPEHRPHVFERFYQVDESATRAQPGTGIGLALARELVELHGGVLVVEDPDPTKLAFGRGDAELGSEAPSSTPEGATFTLTLRQGRAHLREDQLAPEEGPDRGADFGALPEGGRMSEGRPTGVPVGAAALTQGAGGSGAGEGRLAGEGWEEDGDGEVHGDGEVQAEAEAEDITTLLVVDDSADLRAYVRSHFEGRYRVVEAADGAEGIAITRQCLPDLVISDVMMPGTDGHVLCRTLKGDPETDFIPVILLTARAATDDRVAGLEDGADDYLGKPFEMRELSARVENLITSRRRLRERFAPAPSPSTPDGSGPPQGGVIEGDVINGQVVNGQVLESEGHEGRVLGKATAPDSARAGRIPTPSRPSFGDRLETALEEHVSDPAFGVAELARALFVDRTQLFRRTRELLGVSPSELIRQTRLARAEPLLRDGTSGIGEIAYAVGFNSVSHFSRCFRERHGATPSQYRAQYRAQPSAEQRAEQRAGAPATTTKAP